MSPVDSALFAATTPAGRRLAGAWFLLALVALGISALLAIVLVAARTPFLGLGGRFFRTALVLHVDLAVVAWFLAAAAGLWTLARGDAGRTGWGLFGVAATALATLLLSPLLGAPPPVLANYVPVLDSPLFHGALATFAIVIAVAAAWSFGAGGWRNAAPWRQACRWSGLVLLAAAGVAIVQLFDSPRGRAVVPLTFDDRIWGAGHMLQFVYGTLLLGLWALMGQRLLTKAPALLRAYPVLIALNAVAGIAGLLIAFRFDIGSFEQRQAFTELMRWGSWPAIAAAGIGFLVLLVRERREIDGPESGLALSIGLFTLGCVVGAVIDGNATTLVPAHYHGTVGAVTLALLLVMFRFAGVASPALSLSPRLVRLPFVYGAGIAVLVVGLAWSGLSGAPRKAPHEEFALDNAGYLIGMGAAGIGGFVALAAILAFTGAVVAAALTAVPQGRVGARGSRRDVRGIALLATVAAVVVGGLLLGHDGRSTDGGARAHVAEKKRKEVDERFQQGVIMLHAKQYDHALTAFHRVLELAPEMPEAYVNAGFALLGKGEYTAAADFFDEATNLRKDQINAYYGLALALDGLGERRAAIEAMRTYLHRATPADPFRKKGEAAIAQWTAALAAPAGR